MPLLIALMSGGIAAVVAILIHQSMPPIGVLTSLLVTYIAIWMIGRKYGSRRLKWIAFIGWLAVTLRGSTFGQGRELLVQADGVGSTLLMVGTLVAFSAIAARI